MSMISAQIDELREYADRADGTFPLLASALRDAADTIWELRDDLQRANAENAELRDEFDKMDKWHSAELIAEMDENAKLRELAARAWRLFTENGAVHPSDLSEVDAVRDGLRELGVEVDYMGRPLRDTMRGSWEPTFDTDGPELLPCPFCGGAAYYLRPTMTGYAPKMDCKPQVSEYPTYQVECINCGAHSVPAIMHLGCTPAEGKHAAAGRWNQRAELGLEVDG